MKNPIYSLRHLYNGTVSMIRLAAQGPEVKEEFDGLAGFEKRLKEKIKKLDPETQETVRDILRSHKNSGYYGQIMALQTACQHHALPGSISLLVDSTVNYFEERSAGVKKHFQAYRHFEL